MAGESAARDNNGWAAGQLCRFVFCIKAMAAIRFISLCVAFLGVASAFMIPSAGFGLRAALPSVRKNLFHPTLWRKL